MLLIPFLGFSNGEKGKYEKTKTVEEEFNVSSDALLHIKNRYGNVDITTWNENRITIFVEITVSGNSESKINDRLDAIKINFESSNDKVSAETIINKNQSKSWFSWFGSSSNLSYKINYTVKMPKSNDLTIYNDYGNISLTELDGLANIYSDYGRINIGSLNHADNKINIDYASHSTIEFIESGKINADYSKFTIEKANNITLNADYTKSVFGTVNNLRFNCDYGSLRIEKMDDIKGNGDYLTMRFGKLINSLNINANYGSLRIEEVKKDFTSIKIGADYTGVRVGINPDVSTQISASLGYGGFSYDGSYFTFTKKSIKTSSKHYEGYFGDSNSNSSIDISTSYGSVKLYQN
jgi:hypothetical protein